MPVYIVEVPYSGIQTYLVTATSAKEAKKKADEGEAHKDVEPLDFRVIKTFKPSHARLDT